MSISRRYYKPLLWLLALALVAPMADDPIDWLRVLEISTSVIVTALLVEFLIYYRQRIKTGKPTITKSLWQIELLVASYVMLLAAATIQVLLFLEADEGFRPLVLLVTVPQITSLMWLLPMVASMEREHHGES